MEMNVMETIAEIIPIVMKLLFSFIGLLLTSYVLPWAKQQIWYSVIKKFVQAAEKKADAGSIEKPNKKQYVISLMKMFHIPVNDITLALMESAVQELDLLKDEMLLYLDEDTGSGDADDFDLEAIENEHGETGNEKVCETT